MFLHLLQVNHTNHTTKTDCFVTTAASIAGWTIHGKDKLISKVLLTQNFHLFPTNI